MSGTGRADAWVIAMGGSRAASTGEHLPYVLHWSHGTWKVFRFANGAWLNDVLVFSDSDVWVFGAVYLANGEYRS